jgi:NTP pyrophosphatase (non-canonical NTP hydrolase)
MHKHQIYNAIEAELKRAKKKFPNWPDHVAAQAGIVCEEAGELMQAGLEYKYEKGKKGRTNDEQIERMRIEAIHTATMAIRFLENLKQ